MFSRISILALLVISVPISSFAAPVAYQCDVNSYNGHYGGIPDKAYYVIDAEAKTAMAFDRIIHTTSKVPVAVDFEAMSTNKYRLKWTVRNVPLRGNGKAIFSFSARLDVGKMKINMSSWLHGDDMDRRGSGTCKRIK